MNNLDSKSIHSLHEGINEMTSIESADMKAREYILNNGWNVKQLGSMHTIIDQSGKKSKGFHSFFLEDGKLFGKTGNEIEEVQFSE